MNLTEIILRSLTEKLKHNPLDNYILPGLTSWMLTGPNEHGCMRMFESHRASTEFITPHSHRFHFQCFVLEGQVTNTVYTLRELPWTKGESAHDLWCPSELVYGGDPGAYEVLHGEVGHQYVPDSHHYTTGDSYGMEADQIHSITFSKGAKVVFLEGPEVTHHTTILEPWVRGKRVPTFKTEPWMFEKRLSPTTSP